MTQTVVVQFNQDQLALIRQTVAKGTTPEQFSLFVEVCKYHQLNPFARQIYAVVRGTQMTIQTSIDGYRLLAERSGKYAGQVGPEWCGDDGVWRDVWLSDKPPVAARVGVLRKDFQQVTWGVAKYKAFFMSSNQLWTKMPDHMLAIRAEALALRKAFPAEMSGIYTKEEMEQADHDDLPTVPLAGNTTVDAAPASTPPAPRNLRPTAPAPKQNAAPAPTAEQSQDVATPQQKSSIEKLCQHVQMSVPEDLDTMNFTDAKALIAQLTAEYKKQRQESQSRPAQQAPAPAPSNGGQSKALLDMIAKAKSRVEALDMIWDDAKRDAGLAQVEDKDLTPKQVASINSVVAQYEQRQAGKAS